MLAQEVLHRFAARAPDAYGTWGPTDLTHALEPYGAEQYKSTGVMVVARDRVQGAVLERFAEDADDFDDE
ncbi:hypothetical protein ACFV06_15165 [Streptomyces sp. NPDC059618]|uniref:hypothetical protein n=1 Tax=Streptomyces sp. NPDC059618 TaxID=3346887 RepID=UPI003698C61C